MRGVLDGIRVLDFGRYIAGPYCAALLAEHGADVIRIEKRGGSEDRFVAPIAATGEGGLFLQMNRNKRSMTLDPMTGEGREVVRRLVATADVVVANLPPRTLAAMGLDDASLRAARPDLVVASLTAFGREGPWADRVGFDGIGQAMSGAVYLSGDPDAPRRTTVNWVDFATALHAAFGVLVALAHRARTGEGQRVEASLLATAIALHDAVLVEQAVAAPNRVPTGNRGQTAAPADVFRTKDGFVLCQVVGNPLFARWARLVGEEAWLEDPRFRDDRARGDHGDVVSARMARWCAERTTAEAVDALAAAQIPAGPVLAPQEALDHPQTRALGLLEDVDFPGLDRPAPLAKAPVFLSATPGAIRSRPPAVGEHTDAILAELGYGPDEIAALRRAGAV